MSDLKDEDLKRLAKLLVEEVRNEKHDFWIDGEKHYNEHKKVEPLTHEDVLALKEAAEAFRSVRGKFLQIAFWIILLGASAVSVMIALGKVRIG